MIEISILSSSDSKSTTSNSSKNETPPADKILLTLNVEG